MLVRELSAAYEAFVAGRRPERFESSGTSSYDGLVVAFDKRAARHSSLSVSYTLSKSMDDAGNFFFSTPQDNFNLRDERGP